MDHNWPAPGEHLWGPWIVQSKTEHRRQCVHPMCGEVEIKKAPKS